MSFPFRLPVFADGITDCNKIIGNISEDICGEEKVIEKPELLTSFHRQNIADGANVLLVPSARATHTRLSDLNCDDDFTKINKKLTKITVKTTDNKLKVGGCVLSSTLSVAPYGTSKFEDVYTIYLEKITLLKDSGADFILFEEQNNLCDMRCGILAANAVGIPSFIVMNVDDDGKTKSGADFIACLITLQSMGANAFGIYCADGISAQKKLIKQAFFHSEIPLIACFESQKCTDEQIIELFENGASIFIDKSGIKGNGYIKSLSKRKVLFDEKTEKDNYAATVDCEAFFLPDILELSEPVHCDFDMFEKIIDFENENINALHIFLNSTDDSAFLAENSTISRLPLLIHANDAIILEAVLRYYQGRLIIDSCCDIDNNELKRLSKKYGAIIY